MANKIEIDVIANDLASNSLEFVKNKLKEIGGAAGSVGLSAVIMGAAIVTGLSKAKDAAQAYDQQVKELMLRTGGTAEETSRLIQTVDDAGVSYETLSTAMRFAVKNGIEPNIESIARLSTEYLALSSPVERGQFLLEKFGRSGMDMARIMDLGGDAILRMSDAVEAGLIVTDSAIKASEQYRVNVDNLKDSFDGLKVKIGNEVIPVINNFFRAMENGQRNAQARQEAWNQLRAEGMVFFDEEAVNIRAAQILHDDWANAIENTTVKLEENGAAVEAINPKYQTLISLTQQLEGATAQAAQSIAFNMLMAKLSVDGLTQAEYELGIQAGVSMGIFSQKTADTATKINSMTDMVIRGKLNVELLKDAIESLRNRDIEINVAIMGAAALGFQNSQQAAAEANPGRTYNTPGRAAGGPVTAGRAYTVGEVGRELFVPSQNGRIIPNNQLGNSGGMVINLTYAPAFSTADAGELERNLMPLIQRGIKQSRRGAW